MRKFMDNWLYLLSIIAQTLLRFIKLTKNEKELTLPVELLQLIFYHAVQPHSVQQGHHRADSFRSLILVSHVSNRWRHAALGYKFLWSAVDITWKEDHIHAWLRRATSDINIHAHLSRNDESSSESPSTLSMRYPSCLARFTPHLERLASLSIVGASSRMMEAALTLINTETFHNLTHLSIGAEASAPLYPVISISPRRFPQLSSLKVHGFMDILTREPLPKLQYLARYEGFITFYAMRVFTYFSGLETMHLFNGVWLVGEKIPSPASIELPKLKTLGLKHMGNYVIQLLTLLNMPALQEVRIEITNECAAFMPSRLEPVSTSRH